MMPSEIRKRVKSGETVNMNELLDWYVNVEQHLENQIGVNIRVMQKIRKIEQRGFKNWIKRVWKWLCKKS